MSVDIIIHVFENGLTKEDLRAFFSHTLGSKYFNLLRDDHKANEVATDKMELTDQFNLCEVSWDTPTWAQKIINIIGEDLPFIDNDLIEKIRPHADQNLIFWLEQHKGKQIFVVFW